ncbi:unnamed protein product [Sympodiomycopsis kandeliae]
MVSSFGSLSPLNLVVPGGYGYVTLVATGGLWLTTVQGILAGTARKAAKIDYPQAYAEKSQAAASKEAYRFNCVQRSHGNTLENMPTFLFSLLFAGLKHPKVATALGATWLAGRILYTIGYNSGEPKARVKGALPSALGLLGLLGTATYTAVQFIQQAGGF